MKVYVDSELPKKCEDCYFYKNNRCLFDTADCPLDKKIITFNSLADYTKQVRKEVLGELMNMLGDRAELIDCGGVAEFMFTTYDLSMCVKEILGEEKGESEWK